MNYLTDNPEANNLPYTDEELHLINHKNVQVINQLRTLDSAFSLGEGKNSNNSHVWGLRSQFLPFNCVWVVLGGSSIQKDTFWVLYSEGHIALCSEGHYSEYDKENYLTQLSNFNIKIVWVSPSF